MRRLLKSQDYLMKCLGFLLLLGVISLGAIGGCNNNGGKGDGTGVLTEHDFGQDEGLRADPEKHLIVKFLEHPEHEPHENDTGGIGHDVIPHTYTRALNHTFCWEDEDPDAEHFMVIEDSEGNEIVRLHVGDCVTETILEGDYEMKLHHDGKIERNHPIFIKHGQDGDQAAKKDEIIPKGILARAEKVISKILQKLDIGITQTTNAQTVEDNINTLLQTNACPGCNLGGADLSSAVLISADLNHADLNHADLSDAFLGDAFLSGANLNHADLSFADLFNASLSHANLSSALLNNANLTFANLGFADLSDAFWCDGCNCADPSIGTCVGCAPQSTCIGL